MDNLVLALDEAELKIDVAFGQCRSMVDAAALWATLQSVVDSSAADRISCLGGNVDEARSKAYRVYAAGIF